MNATVDGAGRVVIPKGIRTAAHLEPGTKVRIRLTPNGSVEIEPEPLAVDLERRGRFTVAVPKYDQQTLKQEEVDRTLREIRRSSKHL